MWLDLLILFIAWLIFYGVHSALATNRVKQWIGWKPKLYRLVYNLLNTILFVLVLLLTAIVPSYLLLKPSPLTNYSGLMIAAIGIFVIKRAFRNYNTLGFLGLKKEEDQKLKTTGLQAKVRHPLYSGTILLFVGYVLFNPMLTSLVMLLALIVYLPFGIYWEEKKLITSYGNEYLEYKQKVPALFPRLKLNRN